MRKRDGRRRDHPRHEDQREADAIRGERNGLVLAEDVLVDEARAPKTGLVQAFKRIHGLPTTCQDDPLHVASLGATKRGDALLRKHVERERVNPLLIDDDKAPLVACARQTNEASTMMSACGGCEQKTDSYRGDTCR